MSRSCMDAAWRDAAKGAVAAAAVGFVVNFPAAGRAAVHVADLRPGHRVPQPRHPDRAYGTRPGPDPVPGHPRLRSRTAVPDQRRAADVPARRADARRRHARQVRGEAGAAEALRDLEALRRSWPMARWRCRSIWRWRPCSSWFWRHYIRFMEWSAWWRSCSSPRWRRAWICSGGGRPVAARTATGLRAWTRWRRCAKPRRSRRWVCWMRWSAAGAARAARCGRGRARRVAWPGPPPPRPVPCGWPSRCAMLASGATLAIDHQVTGGTICAAAILLGRVLFPFEQLIDGWRQWAGARAAWRAHEARGALERADADRGGGRAGRGSRRFRPGRRRAPGPARR